MFKTFIALIQTKTVGTNQDPITLIQLKLMDRRVLLLNEDEFSKKIFNYKSVHIV